MCFFYALAREAEKLENRLGVTLNFDFRPVYYASGFDFPQMPVVTNTEPDRAQLFNWGLIPSWTKPENVATMRSYTLNARSDSLFVKPSFRGSILQKRCLVPATGFYEWQTVGGKKYPYHVYLKTEDVFCFAGLWEEWTDRSSGELTRTFSIITTEANPLLARIHNLKKRMPVILPPNLEGDWLRQDLTREGIQALTEPLDDSLLAAHTISRLITSRNLERNVLEIQDRVTYPELIEV